MEKKIRSGILLITLTLMVCVWPLCLVRKTVDVSSDMASGYGKTEQFVSQETPYIQTFVAQTAKLEYIQFSLAFEKDISVLDGAVYVKLVDEDEKVIVEKELPFEKFSKYFWEVDVNKWIVKGEEYKVIVTVDEKYSDIFRGTYTLAPEHDAPGNVSLYMGHEKIGGQGLICYGYGYPLNIKNVVCLWAFILTVGLSIYICCGTEKDFTLPGKFGMVWDKLWSLLHKYQVLILIIEMLGILLMIAYICRNKAVDWDEAYSVGMITKYSLSEMIRTTALDIHPPLYYLLLRCGGTIFGTEFFALKMMSVLFTSGVMILGITMIRKNWGARAAFLFNLVVGLGPQFIFYSVYIRMYSLELFFVMWNALLAYEIIQGKGKLRWILFVLSGLGGAYTHYFAVVPLTLIYGYLLVGLFLERRKDCKYFFLCCVATVAGYLPWLSVVIDSFRREGLSDGIHVAALDVWGFVTWAFSTNIKFSSEMPVILFLVGIVLLILRNKGYTRQKRMFLALCATNMLLVYLISGLIASMNNHFWDNRYAFGALALFWLFIVITYSEKGRMTSCALAVCLGVIVLSAYTIQKSRELGTNAYLDDTYEILEQVRQEEVILYNFPTYHVLYGAHLPEQDFIWIDDMDWENYEEDYIYFISWGSKEIPWSIQEAYQMELLDCGTLRFEEGMAGIKLYKVCFQKGQL